MVRDTLCYTVWANSSGLRPSIYLALVRIKQTCSIHSFLSYLREKSSHSSPEKVLIFNMWPAYCVLNFINFKESVQDSWSRDTKAFMQISRGKLQQVTTRWGILLVCFKYERGDFHTMSWQNKPWLTRIMRTVCYCVHKKFREGLLVSAVSRVLDAASMSGWFSTILARPASSFLL